MWRSWDELLDLWTRAERAGVNIWPRRDAALVDRAGEALNRLRRRWVSPS